MRRALLLAGCAVVLAVPGAASATTVTTMVVGKSRVLRDAKALRPAERRVRVGSRRCTVGARTPLAALARMGLPLKLKDYGSCGRRARDASLLYVKSVGGERSRGQDGWVYKVGRRVGSNGAADLSGPFGSGRLRSGARVLWFWCVSRPGGGCQRTLEAVPDRSAAAPGQSVRVAVRGYDDQGRGVPVAGATVTLGPATALTGPDGVATVAVAQSGRLRLRAAAPGLVPSFPRVLTAG